MTIVIYENFQQDTLESLPSRYPGTYVVPTPDVPQGSIPFRGPSILQTGIIPFTQDNQRLEILLSFVPQEDTSDGRNSMELFIFGVQVLGGASANNYDLTIAGQPVPNMDNKETLHIIVEKEKERFNVIVLMDGAVVLTPTVLDSFVPSSYIGATSNFANVTSMQEFIRGLPDFLTSVTVAVDTPTGTRIDEVDVYKRRLDVTASGEWNYTNEGYVQDTDHSDPTIEDPNIYAPNPSSITFKIIDTIEADITNVYNNASTNLPETVVAINGEGSYVQPQQPKRVGRIHRLTKEEIELTTVRKEGLGGNTNGDIVFVGEVPASMFITYSELSNELGVTQGSVRDSSWLEFFIDGKPMFVSTQPVRTGISWEHIYQAGLVYGVDGPGLFPYPEDQPVNQYRTVTINGTEYLVRLLKGGDVDLIFSTPATDFVGTYRSEWSRLFYPIYNTRLPSYSGPMLANYSAQQLWFRQSSGGALSWVQEATTNEEKASRVRIGYNISQPTAAQSASTRSAVSANNASGANGWRPCLIPVN